MFWGYSGSPACHRPILFSVDILRNNNNAAASASQHPHQKIKKRDFLLLLLLSNKWKSLSPHNRLVRMGVCGTDVIRPENTPEPRPLPNNVCWFSSGCFGVVGGEWKTPTCLLTDITTNSRRGIDAIYSSAAAHSCTQKPILFCDGSGRERRSDYLVRFLHGRRDRPRTFQVVVTTGSPPTSHRIVKSIPSVAYWTLDVSPKLSGSVEENEKM